MSADGVFTGVDGGRFKLIENYMYLYHTDTLIVLPTYPESIADSMGVNYQPTTPLARSAPIYSYISSGPRTFQISLPLHRELLYDVNRATALQVGDSINSDDYMNLMIKQIQASALPKYNANEKQVNPPTVAIKFGNDIFCKGVITGAVTATYSGPILKTNSYAMVTLDFTVNEIDPYDAVTVAELGGYRGLNTTLEGRVWGKDV